MRLVQHLELWNKIQQFPLDEPDATITFSSKLASQQKWSAGYTQRVIEEYRRFILLCCISPKGASPSKAVDEAWHLHLTYTQSYWIAFCKHTLGKDIHHYPSSGGDKEDHKHENWYAETLALYTEVFGMAPPADIWPSAVRKQYPVIPPLDGRPAGQTVLLVVLLMIIPFVLCYVIYEELSPFSLRGPEFLQFYGLLMAVALGSFYLLRNDRRNQLVRVIKQYFPSDVTMYQLTHLVHGRHRAIQTGVVDLFRRNLLEVQDDNSIIVHNKRYSATDKEENPLVPGFLSETDQSKVNYEMMSVNWYNQSPYTHPVLEQLNVLAFPQEFTTRKYFVIIIALAFGVARMFQGLFNDRPVLFLVGEMLLTAGIALYIDHKVTGKNSLHQAADAMLWSRFYSNKLHSDNVVADYALSGQGALSGIAAGLLLTTIFSSFNTPPLTTNQSGDAANSYDSSCTSNSSCSGGSSCGGGGGCGGCGSSD